MCSSDLALTRGSLAIRASWNCKSQANLNVMVRGCAKHVKERYWPCCLPSCDAGPVMPIEAKVFMITGKFSSAKRDEIIQDIVREGG